MKEVFCSQCGQKNPEGYRFCAYCGAPGPQMTSGPKQPERPDSPQAAPVFSGGLGRVGQPPYAVPPPGKTPLYQILLLAGSSLLLAGALAFGAYKLFIEAPSLDAVSFDMKTAAESDVPQETPRATEPSASAPAPTPTEMPSTPAPALTPSPAPSSEGIGYDSIVGRLNVPGITEEAANQLFGPPQFREMVEYPDGFDIQLTYDSFVLMFLTEGKNPTTCYQVQITATPCPISVFGLAVGMDTADVKAAMASSPFELNYEEPDGSYWVCSNDATGQDIFVNFTNGIMTDYFVFYSP